MNSIPAGLRRLVAFRAGGRCEYCGLAQEGQEATFESVVLSDSWSIRGKL